MIDISSTLKELRVKNDYTQEELAELCNVSRQAVAKWETGTNLPDIEKIIQLSKIFKVSVDELLTGRKTLFEENDHQEQIIVYSENEKVVNKALEKAINCSNPNEGITIFISYIGEQIGYDRIHIFELTPDGNNFQNTYEWCNIGVSIQKEFLQCVPIKDLSLWLKTFIKSGYVFIPNIDEITDSDPGIYRWLKPAELKSVLAYPLFGGRAFITVDNPAPVFISQTIAIIKTMLHFVENMLQRKNLRKALNCYEFKNKICEKAVNYRIDFATGQIIYDKEQAAKAGYLFKADTVTKMKAFASIHPEFYEHAVIDGFETAIESKKNTSVEFVSYKDDKHIRWNKLTMSPFLDSEGNILQLYGILQDISESHQIIEKYNKHVRNSSCGLHICYLSRPVHLEYASNNLCEFLGYSRKDFDTVVGSKYTNIMVEEDIPVFRAFYKKLTEKTGIESCKYRLIKKDGSIVSVIDTMESILDSNGVMYGYAFMLPEEQLQNMLEMSEENEKKHIDLINLQNEVIEVLDEDYLNVYRIWLDEDKGQVIRLKGYVTKGLDRRNSDFFPFYAICKQYIKDRVHPDDKKKMLEAMHPDTVRKAFKNKDEYIVTYRVIDNSTTHYYQLKYTKIKNPDYKEKNSFVAGFKNIDQLIEKEQSDNKNLQSKIAIINTILQAFTCGYYMEYSTDTFIELSNVDERMSKLIGKSGNFTKNRERMKNAFIDKSAYKKIDDFLNIETLKTRLHNHSFITTKVKIEGYGTYEMYLFIVDYDDNGKIAHSILLAKEITGDK